MAKFFDVIRLSSEDGRGSSCSTTRWTYTLRVVLRSLLVLVAQKCAHCGKELAQKLRYIAGENVIWYSLGNQPVVEEDVCNLRINRSGFDKVIALETMENIFVMKTMYWLSCDVFENGQGIFMAKNSSGPTAKKIRSFRGPGYFELF